MKVTRVVPTQLTYQHLCKKTPHICHISSMEHASFNPAHTTPCCPATTPHCGSPQTPPRPVHHHLSCTSDSSESDKDPDSPPEHSDEEDDFQTVPIDDEHWTADIVPERTFCIHENGLPNNVCQYPCPYGNSNTASYMDSFRLKSIFPITRTTWWPSVLMKNYQDWKKYPTDIWTLVCLNTYLTFNYNKLCITWYVTAFP